MYGKSIVRTLSLAGDTTERLGRLVADHLDLIGVAEPLNEALDAVLGAQLSKDIGDLVSEERRLVRKARGEGLDRRLRRRSDVAKGEHSAVPDEERERGVEVRLGELGNPRLGRLARRVRKGRVVSGSGVDSVVCAARGGLYG